MLKEKIKGVLTSFTVAMVTSDVIKMTSTCSAMIGYSFDTIFVVLINVCSTDPSKYESWKVLKTVLSLLKSMVKKAHEAIYRGVSNGPTFGPGWDIYISNSNTNSHSDFGDQDAYTIVNRVKDRYSPGWD